MHRVMCVALVAALVLAIVPEALAGRGTTDQDRTRTQDQLCDCVDEDSPGVLFVDEDGDGVCDNCPGNCNPDAPDDDGDGIPNGHDDDYTPPADGTGQQHRGNQQ